jgi:hypothetical protein
MQWTDYTTMRPINRYSNVTNWMGHKGGNVVVMRAVVTQIQFFWDVTPWRRVTIYWRFWTKVARQFSRSSRPRGVTLTAQFNDHQFKAWGFSFPGIWRFVIGECFPKFWRKSACETSGNADKWTSVVFQTIRILRNNAVSTRVTIWKYKIGVQRSKLLTIRAVGLH